MEIRNGELRNFKHDIFFFSSIPSFFSSNILFRSYVYPFFSEWNVISYYFNNSCSSLLETARFRQWRIYMYNIALDSVHWITSVITSIIVLYTIKRIIHHRFHFLFIFSILSHILVSFLLLSTLPFLFFFFFFFLKVNSVVDD